MILSVLKVFKIPSVTYLRDYDRRKKLGTQVDANIGYLSLCVVVWFGGYT